ncbi:unnamed protein product [Tenebrio molitor]|nr:unnamed protein product [Tenebrio molitor]
MNNFLRTLLFLSGTKFGCGFSPGMGPIGPINILELRECDPPINNINGDIKLHTEKDKSKSVSLSFDTAQDYGDELDATFNADKWENNAWQKDVYSDNRNFFDFIDSYWSKVWQNAANKISPPITDSRKIPSGQHSLEFFKDTYKNIDMPQVLYGRFRCILTISAGDEDLICLKTEIEVSPPL